MKIKETFKEAFGVRFFGFAMFALLPATYIIIEGLQLFGVYILIPTFIYILFWLLIIRITL